MLSCESVCSFDIPFWGFRVAMVLRRKKKQICLLTPALFLSSQSWRINSGLALCTFSNGWRDIFVWRWILRFSFNPPLWQKWSRAREKGWVRDRVENQSPVWTLATCYVLRPPYNAFGNEALPASPLLLWTPQSAPLTEPYIYIQQESRGDFKMNDQKFSPVLSFTDFSKESQVIGTVSLPHKGMRLRGLVKTNDKFFHCRK